MRQLADHELVLRGRAQKVVLELRLLHRAQHRAVGVVDRGQAARRHRVSGEPEEEVERRGLPDGQRQRGAEITEARVGRDVGAATRPLVENE